MAKKKKENDIVTDGSRAITKFHVSDVVMVVILVILMCDLCSSVYSLAGKVCFK